MKIWWQRVHCQNGNQDLAKLFINQGADQNYENMDGFTAVNIAAKNSHDLVCKLLADTGADLNILDMQGNPPLYYVCQEGSYDLAKLFIKQGADPDSAGCLQKFCRFCRDDLQEMCKDVGCALRNHMLGSKVLNLIEIFS